MYFKNLNFSFTRNTFQRCSITFLCHRRKPIVNFKVNACQNQCSRLKIFEIYFGHYWVSLLLLFQIDNNKLFFKRHIDVNAKLRVQNRDSLWSWLVIYTWVWIGIWCLTDFPVKNIIAKSNFKHHVVLKIGFDSNYYFLQHVESTCMFTCLKLQIRQYSSQVASNLWHENIFFWQQWPLPLYIHGHVTSV